MFDKQSSFNPVKVGSGAKKPEPLDATTIQQQQTQFKTENPGEAAKMKFTTATPWEYNHGSISAKTKRKAGIAGIAFASFVVFVYAFSFRHLNQQDFSDVLIPENVREKYKIPSPNAIKQQDQFAQEVNSVVNVPAPVKKE